MDEKLENEWLIFYQASELHLEKSNSFNACHHRFILFNSFFMGKNKKRGKEHTLNKKFGHYFSAKFHKILVSIQL